MASVRSVEHNRPIMRTPLGHWDQSRIRRRRSIQFPWFLNYQFIFLLSFDISYKYVHRFPLFFSGVMRMLFYLNFHKGIFQSYFCTIKMFFQPITCIPSCWFFFGVFFKRGTWCSWWQIIIWSFSCVIFILLDNFSAFYFIDITTCISPYSNAFHSYSTTNSFLNWKYSNIPNSLWGCFCFVRMFMFSHNTKIVHIKITMILDLSFLYFRKSTHG